MMRLFALLVQLSDLLWQSLTWPNNLRSQGTDHSQYSSFHGLAKIEKEVAEYIGGIINVESVNGLDCCGTK